MKTMKNGAKPMPNSQKSSESIEQNYPSWRKSHFSAAAGQSLKSHSGKNNLFSIYIHTGTSDEPSTDHERLTATIESLHQQTYRNIEARICGKALSNVSFSKLLHQWKEDFQCLRGIEVSSNDYGPTAKCGTRGLLDWRGDYLLWIEEGTILEKNAMESLNTVINVHQGTKPPEIIVIDHEYWDPAVASSLRPYFFPGWDPDLMTQAPSLGKACAISRVLLTTYSELSRFANDPHSTTMDEWIALLSKHYPWPESAHLSSPVMRFCNQGLPLHSFPAPSELEPAGGLSIIIPNKNNPHLLRNCVHFLENHNDSNIELIIVDNGSTDADIPALYEDLKKRHGAMIISMPGLFNYSKLINAGAQHATCEYLLLLNNDVIIPEIEKIWSLADLASQPGVGVVGSILMYPNRRIQHAGILLTQGYCASHVMRNAEEEDVGPGNILRTLRNYQAVTGALQIMKTSIFKEVNGYDEIHLPVEFNDVDFCLRVREKGHKILCAPMLGIIHAESSTRQEISPIETVKDQRESKSYMMKRWQRAFNRDPFSNPNLLITDRSEPGLTPINS